MTSSRLVWLQLVGGLGCGSLMVGVALANPLAPCYFSLVGPSEDPGIPPDGTQWEQIEPDYGWLREQLAWIDNGDLAISADDELELSYLGQGFLMDPPELHYHLERESLEWILAPGLSHNREDPHGEIWEERYPHFGNAHAMSEWQDANQSGVFDAGDVVRLDGEEWSVEQITLGLIAYFPNSAVHTSTWSRIKARLGFSP